MKRYTLKVDTKRCIGCQACEIACKQEFNLPVGPRWIKVDKVGPRYNGDKLEMEFVPFFCTHCDDPECIEACPEGAIYKRPDGIVLVEKSKCTGCKLCIEACPTKAPQFNPEEGVVGFCTLCSHRIDENLEPVCKLVCPAKCIYFGDIKEVDKIIQSESR